MHAARPLVAEFCMRQTVHVRRIAACLACILPTACPTLVESPRNFPNYYSPMQICRVTWHSGIRNVLIKFTKAGEHATEECGRRQRYKTLEIPWICPWRWIYGYSCRFLREISRQTGRRTDIASIAGIRCPCYGSRRLKNQGNEKYPAKYG
jgi:hypothetical protein